MVAMACSAGQGELEREKEEKGSKQNGGGRKRGR
jgi:hypothetical protein